MKDKIPDQFVIAAPEATAAKLLNMLNEAQIEPVSVVHTGAEAAEAAKEAGVLLMTWRLDDMSGEELIEKVGEETDVLMIVPGDYAEKTADNVLLLRNPMTRDTLVQAVRVMLHCRARIEKLTAEKKKVSAKLEERKLVDRAKGRLMDALHLSESQAHYYIQKKSMDSGRRIIDVAQEILSAEEILPE